MSHHFLVGQTVYVHETFNQGRRADTLFQAKVLKVGRKWAKIDLRDYQFDIHTLQIDGGQYSSPGRVYLHELDYRNDIILKKVSADLYGKLNALPRPGVTIEAIRQAAILLNIELDA